jgi:hypothetical protein
MFFTSTLKQKRKKRRKKPWKPKIPINILEGTLELLCKLGVVKTNGCFN